jgi:hypothetical protein
MEEINSLIKKFNNYFNNISKSFYKFPETYNIQFDETKNRFIGTPSLPNSQYINILRDSKNRSAVEQLLLQGLAPHISDLVNINIYAYDDYFIITFSYSKGAFNLPEYKILAQLASEYKNNKLNKLCMINENFARACRNPLFWEELFKLKYPKDYEKVKNKGLNYRKVLQGMKSLESLSNLVLMDPQGVGIIKKFAKNHYETFKFGIHSDKLKDEVPNKLRDHSAYLNTVFDSIDFTEDSAQDLVMYIWKFENSEDALVLIYEELILMGKKGINIIQKLKQHGNNEVLIDLESDMEYLQDFLHVMVENKLGPIDSFKYILGLYEINNGGPINDGLIIGHYLYVANEEIADYLLSKIDVLTEQVAFNMARHLIQHANPTRFNKFYQKFKQLMNKNKMDVLKSDIGIKREHGIVGFKI